MEVTGMIYVDNGSTTDPRVNLALEEYLLRHLETDEDILLFYINAPSIIIGRNQNTLEEINHEYVQANGIHVVRRLSGGGAVYHDLGNLNFSFITNYEASNFRNFRKFTKPVIEVLHSLGVMAELSGRNDILVAGRKISGTAQYSTSRRMFSHGTLLFDSQLEHVVEALRVKMSKISSKGIKSVRSRVANISEFMRESMTIEAFRQQLLEGIFAGYSSIPQYRLTAEDWQGIHKLVEERYSQWDWNFGRSPDFNVQRTQRFAFGEIDAHIDVQHGRIEVVRFFGDFLGNGDLTELEARLQGVRYDSQALAEALAGVDVTDYFGGISLAEFVAFLY
jgi:lipoate-protein ligase A